MNDSTSQTSKTPLVSNRFYDRLKYIALVILPALGSLYFGIGEIWGLPKIQEVVGTITVIDTFLGLILRQSNKAYQRSDARFDGHIDVIEDEDAKLYSLQVDGDPAEVLEKKDEMLFKVNKDIDV